ncbi:hypothetical protein [Vibrio sp.]|uniref:hypothetical protein n=1 Tax=Vibrio sp. TaxID=678 RepID=UPI003AA980DC
MLYTKQLKDIAADVRKHIKNGDTETALKYLDMVDMYADYNRVEEPFITAAIQGLAKVLGTTEPKALEAVALQGFHDLGRVMAIGGKSFIQAELDMKKPMILNNILPNFGVTPLTARAQAEYLEREKAKKSAGGTQHGK